MALIFSPRFFRPRLSLLVEAVLWSLLGTLFLAAFTYHSIHCTFPYQLAASEAGMLQTTRAYSLGKDPWSLANAFNYSNDYGAVYPWVVAKLMPLAPKMNLLVLMRLVSAAAAFLALGLIFLVLRQAGLSALEGAAACSSAYAALLYHDTLTARPDALAVAFYIAALVWPSRPGRWNAALGGVLAVGGFFVKPYAVLAAPMAAVYLWAVGRSRDIVWLGLGAVLSGLVLVLLVMRLSPYYFDLTYFIHLNATRYSVKHLLGQWGQLALVHVPLLAGVVGAKFLAPRQQGAESADQDRQARAWAWVVTAIFVALALGPGGHVGAYLRYYQQLFLPLAILAAALWMARQGLPRWLCVLVLLSDGAGMLAFNVRSNPLISYQQQEEWKRIEAWVGDHPYGLYPPMLVSVAVEKRAFVFENDHNRYLMTLLPEGPIRQDAIARCRTVVDELKAGHFDSIVDYSEMPYLSSGPHPKYRQVEPFNINTPLSRARAYVYERIDSTR
jgi:hypothetical protein